MDTIPSEKIKITFKNRQLNKATELSKELRIRREFCD